MTAEFDKIRAEAERLCPGVEVRERNGWMIHLFLPEADNACVDVAFETHNHAGVCMHLHGSFIRLQHTEKLVALLAAALHVAKWMESRAEVQR